MGDHFIFLVDRLVTESTLEAAIESRNQKQLASWTTNEPTSDCSSHDSGVVLTPRGKMVECRICQDEDMDSNMETPCSCCGSLKYAHRRCVQRWCNEKGDTICEICHQPFQPGYTAPPSIFRLGGIPMNIRGNWRIVRRSLNNQHLIAVVSTDHNFINSDYDDDDDDGGAVSPSSSMMCCRAVVIMFLLLLVIGQALPIIINHVGDYSLPLVMLLLLRLTGIILPAYIIMKTVTSCHHRQHQQATLPISSTSEQAGLVSLQQVPLAIDIQ